MSAPVSLEKQQRVVYRLLRHNVPGFLATSIRRHRAVSGGSAVVACVALLVGLRLAVVIAAGAVLLLVAWQCGLHRLLGRRLQGWWRRRWIYGRSWESVAAAAGLSHAQGERRTSPRLRRLKCDQWAESLRVRMLPGQTVADYEAVADRLAASFGHRRCRVLSPRPGLVELQFPRRDPLAGHVPAVLHEGPAAVDLAAVQVGRTEHDDSWRLPVLGAHVLVAGATGAGKGSVVWSVLAGLGPAIHEGLVEVWVLDPKGGMELAFGAPLFARFCYGPPEEHLGLLDQAVTTMQARADRLRGVTRQHHPTVDEPLILLVVDELAALTAYVPDVKDKKRIAAALGLLLSQGRAVGVSVLACVQDPSKETVPLRDLFPVRVGLRLTEPEQVRMVLGDGARARGAACDRLSPAAPGVGYVLVDGAPEPLRVRASFISDDAVRVLAATFARPRSDAGSREAPESAA